MIQYQIYKHVSPQELNKNVINYVIYSHSSFSDVLEIQLKFMLGKGHLTLFIDKNDQNLQYIYQKFDKIIFYDDRLTYGQKVLNCLSQIDYEYFVFIHDNDILYEVDNQKVLEFINFLKVNNYDRVDFQLAKDFNRERAHTIKDDELYLIKSSNIDLMLDGYIFNINPSIWKLETFKKIVREFSHKCYRTIELSDTQQFCTQFDFFKLYSKKQFNCGYFTLLEPFKYLHITHGQRFINLNEFHEQSIKDIKNIYLNIIEEFNLKNSAKWLQ